MTVSVSYDDLKAIVPRYSGPKGIRQNEICKAMEAALPPLLDEFAINTPLRVAHFLAQLAHESAGFRTTREFASGAAYEGRKDLGNVRKGDGERFRGRGLIQVTGRSNYTAFSKWMRRRDKAAPSFVTAPEKLEGFPWAIYSALWYWTTRRLNKYADKDDLRSITKIINGGYNGLTDRQRKLDKAKRRFASQTGATINMLALGDKGEAVARWQETLAFFGYNVTVDGYYGPHTLNATHSLQEMLGLKQDGVAGPKTMTAALKRKQEIASEAMQTRDQMVKKGNVLEQEAAIARDVVKDAAATGRVSKTEVSSGIGGAVVVTGAIKELSDNVGGALGNIADYVPDWFVPAALIAGAGALAFVWWDRRRKKRVATRAQDRMETVRGLL